MKLSIASILFSGLLIVGALFYEPNLQDTNLLSANMIETVNPNIFSYKNNKDERIIIDVRTSKEYDDGHIKGARNIDFYSENFAFDMEELDKSAKYSIYCRSGNRSGQALVLMESLGFEDVIDLDGGVVAWERAGETLCTDC